MAEALSDLSVADLPIPALEIDIDGTITAANSAAETLLQVRPGRLVGVPLGCFMPVMGGESVVAPKRTSRTRQKRRVVSSSVPSHAARSPKSRRNSRSESPPHTRRPPPTTVRYERWRMNYVTPNIPAQIRDGRGKTHPARLLTFMVGERHIFMFLP